MKPISFFLVISLILVTVVVAFVYTRSKVETPSVREVPVEARFDTKLVYTTNTATSSTPFRAHCEREGGVFNECGTPCAPDADMCVEVCAYTCEYSNATTDTDVGTGEREVVIGTPNVRITSPQPNELITSPLTVRGEARGGWYFEASFSVILTNWDGLIIAEAPAQAVGDWMTEDFVPYSAELFFESPYHRGDPAFMQSGTLILQKANPSGLPENADAFEIPIRFAGDE